MNYFYEIDAGYSFSLKLQIAVKGQSTERTLRHVVDEH